MLHPQVKALLDLIEQTGVPPIHTLTPVDARKAYRERGILTQPSPAPVASAHDLRAEGPTGPIPLRLYRPLGNYGGSRLPALIYFHGGGFVMGDLETHDILCRGLSNGSGCVIVAVDYKLAPEHRFPAAVDDCVAAVDWIFRHAASLGIDPDRIGLGGDSAGANLAAVACISARDAGVLPIRFQLLIYPITETQSTAPSRQANGQGYLLTRETIAYFRDHYIGEPAYDRDWRASPVLCDDLTNLPPAFILAAGYDPLRDEAIAYSQRLSEAGNSVAYICFERQIHGFITMGKVIDEANTAVAICAGEIRRGLGEQAPQQTVSVREV